MSEEGDLRLAAGMVGGGEGADIGKSHRHAMRLDGHYDLVAGVFGRDPIASTRMAERLGVPADRVYRDYAEMADRAAAVSRYTKDQVIGDGLHNSWFERVAASYRTALDHFVDALEGRGVIGPNLDEALKAQAIAEAATLSLTTGQMEPIKYG
jgi:predicted dehydrogenase